MTPQNKEVKVEKLDSYKHKKDLKIYRISYTGILKELKHIQNRFTLYKKIGEGKFRGWTLVLKRTDYPWLQIMQINTDGSKTVISLSRNEIISLKKILEIPTERDNKIKILKKLVKEL